MEGIDTPREAGLGALAAVIAIALLSPASSAAFEPLSQVGSSGNGAGQFGVPIGAAIAANGDLYVNDNGLNRINQFAADGTFIRAWGFNVIPGGTTGFEICTTTTTCQAGQVGGGAGQLNSPNGIDIDAAGDVFVTETLNSRVSQFSSTGTFVRAWGRDVDPAGGTGFEVCTTATGCKAGISSGGAAGTLNVPNRLAISGTNLYVTELSNNRVSQFTTAGAFVRAWGFDVDPAGGTGFETCTTGTTCKAGVSGEAAGQLSTPRGIAVGAGGDVYVGGGARINEFTSTGAFVRAWGFDVDPAGGTGFETCTTATGCKAAVVGGAAGQLGAFSFGIQAASNGNVYVAENERVSEFTAAGAFVRAFGFDVIAGGTTGFEICTTATGCKSAVAGSGFGQLNGSSDVGVDSCGSIWVADGASNARLNRYGEAGAPPCVPPPDPTPTPTPEPTPTPTLPSNQFTIGKAKLNKDKGTAKLPVEIPGSGTLELAGKLVKGQQATAGAAGEVTLALKAKGKAKAKLADKGTAKVKVEVTFTPTGGSANTESAKVKLRKKG